MTIITTRTDLVNWIRDTCALDGTTAGLVANDIQDEDHPAWGADWTEYLDGLDVPALASPYVAAS